MDRKMAPRWKRPTKWLVLSGLLLGSLSSVGGGQEVPSENGGSSAMFLARLSGPIQVDGDPSDPPWREVQPLPLTTYTPVSGGQPTEQSDIRIGYDDGFLYMIASLYDREPDQIQEVSLYRDRTAGDDQVVLMLDTFNDNETGRYFITTPGGVRVDGLVAEDGIQVEDGWNTYWDVSTARNAEGWFAEFRIPFSSLGFQSVGDTVEMGLIAFRIIARKDEIDVFPPTSREDELGRSSLAQKVRMVGVRTGTPRYFTPYLTSGRGWNSELREDLAAFGTEVESLAEVGGDLRVHLAENLTLDLTVNTDFAQVEADDQQVNLSRFSLFFPEKRQAFLERSSIFQFPTGGRSLLFHSRHVGLNDGASVRILGGGRLVGKVGPWDLGAISMQTQAERGLPAENFTVLRARRQVFNPYSNTGVMIVSRIGEDGRYNVASGLDASLRVRGDDYLTLRWAQTFDDDVRGGPGFQESALLQAEAFRLRSEGFVYRVGGRWAGEDYMPATGFMDRRDFSELSWDFSYQKLFGAESRFRSIQPFQLWGSVILRNEDRSVESAEFQYAARAVFRDSGSLWWRSNLRFESLVEDLSLPGNALVPLGQYWFSGTSAGYRFPMDDLVKVNVSGAVSQFYDGRMTEFMASPSWRKSTHFQLGMTYSYVNVHFPDRDQFFHSHLLRTRINTALNTKLSLNAFVQLSSVADFAAANARIRYNFREGQDLWLVYNEEWNLDRFRSDPVLPRTENRTLLMKYTHVLSW